MSSRTKIMMGAFGAFLLLAAGYFFFFNDKGTSGSAVTQTTVQASSAELMFLNLSSQLDSISFDTSIFSDSRFNALQDMHTAILPESQGRTDPFASVASGN